MTPLDRWTGPVDPGPFRFGKAPTSRLRVVRRVVKAGPDGPRFTGDILTRDPGGTYDHHHDATLAGRPYPADPNPEE